MVSQPYNDNIGRARQLGSVRYFHEDQGERRPSYAWQAIDALERGDTATLNDLTDWHSYVFPYLEKTRSEIREHSPVDWDFSIKGTLDILNDECIGWNIGYAVHVLRASNETFLRDYLGKNEGIGEWLDHWLEMLGLVFIIPGLENHPEARIYCRDTLDHLVARDVGLKRIKKFSKKELRAIIQLMEEYKIPHRVYESPFYKGISKARANAQAPTSAPHGQHTTTRDGYKRPTFTFSYNYPLPRQEDSYGQQPRSSSKTAVSTDHEREKWIHMLQSLQEKRKFTEDQFPIHVRTVFPRPKTPQECRDLLEDERQAFRLGYATMVLKETFTTFQRLGNLESLGGEAPAKWFEDNIPWSRPIQHCMTIVDAILNEPGVETDNDAKNLCKEVLEIFFGGVKSKTATDLLEKPFGKKEKTSAEASNTKEEGVLEGRTKESSFQRGMLVAKELDRLKGVEGDVSEDEGVLWKKMNRDFWEKRWNGMAWLDLVKIRPKMVEYGN